MMTRHPLLLYILVGGAAAPLHSQDAERLSLPVGTPVQVQVTGDSTWHDADIVSVGPCAMVSLASSRSDSGIVATSFGSIAALRLLDASRSWHHLGAAQMRRFRGCTIEGGPAAAVDPACGTAPDIARAGIMGMLYGMRMNPDPASPWGPFIGYARDDIVPVTDGATCLRIVAALYAARSGGPVDTLPLAGVLQLSDQGFVVYRSRTLGGPGGRIEMSNALLDTRLRLLDYRRFTY